MKKHGCASLKTQRRFMDGGAIKETPEQLMARMAAKYGGGASASAETPPPAPAAPVTPSAPVAKPKNLFSLMSGRKEQIDQQTNGYANGGKIKGPGTPKSDSIRGLVRETREPIDVSTDERILSAEQDAALEQLAIAQGFESLDAMLEAMTGEPVGPTIDVGVKKAATGMAPEQNQTNSLNAPYAAGGLNDPKASFSPPQRAATTPAVAQLSPRPAPAINMMTPVDQLFPERKFAFGGRIDPERDYSLPEGKPLPVTPRTPEITPRVSLSQAFQADDASMRAADPSGYAAQAAKAQAESAPGLQERTFQLTSAPRSLASPMNPMASPAAVASAPEPQATPRRITSFSETGTTMDSRNPLTSINMAANNESLAKANSIRDSIGNDGTGPKVTMLGNSGRAETQNLMDKWDRENQARSTTQEIGRNPRAANALAGLFSSGLSAETQQRGQDVRQQTDMTVNAANNETNRRGQDVTLRTRLAEMAGNPLDNALKQTQTAAIQSGLDDKKRTAAIMEEMQNPATTPERRKALLDSVLAPLGKTANDNMRENFMAVGGGQEYDQAAGVMRNVPQRLIDLRTGKVVGADGGQPSTAAQPLPPKNQLKVGQTYQTGRGPAVWNGTGFDQA